MDKTAKSEIRRVFLIEKLPEPLSPASRHIQIFDNYVAITRIRLRNSRIPETGEWSHVLQQVFPAVEGDLTRLKVAEIYLNETEYAVFEAFEGREIRKNRYFHEIDGKLITFDVHLGELWGLTTAKVEFDELVDAQLYEPPPMMIFEVTNDPFFLGQNLVGKKFADVQEQVASVEARFRIPEPPVTE